MLERKVKEHKRVYNYRRLTKLRMRDALVIFLGTTIMSVAVKYVFDPAALVTGGVSGLAIVLKAVTGNLMKGGIPLWLSNVILNVPIFLFAIYAEGFRSIIRTGLSWIIMSIELAIFPDYNLLPDNLFLVSVYGGILFGAGTGILLSARATSGGTDMLGKSLQVYFPHFSMGKLIAVLDGIVVVLGAIVFDVEHTLFAIISVFVMGEVTDWILDRGKKAKIALIISKESASISDEILTTMDRGVTAIPGTGKFSGESKEILICVCRSRDLPDLRDIVKTHDKRAFFVVGSISEARGEGFVEKWS